MESRGVHISNLRIIRDLLTGVSPCFACLEIETVSEMTEPKLTLLPGLRPCKTKDCKADLANMKDLYRNRHGDPQSHCRTGRDQVRAVILE